METEKPGKQPRPAAEEGYVSPQFRANVDKAFWTSVTEVSPAAHTAQDMTFVERSLLNEVAALLRTEKFWQRHSELLRRLAEQGSGAKSEASEAERE